MGVRIALLVLNVFAALWAWVGLRLSGITPGLSLLPVAVSFVLLALGWRGAALVPARGAQVGRVVGLWTAVESIALFAVAQLLGSVHRPDLMLPAGAVIVGLHFFPLAQGIPVRLYHATGAGLLFVGVVGFLLPKIERPLAVGLGAALVLWGTALIIILRSPQARRAAT